MQRVARPGSAVCALSGLYVGISYHSPMLIRGLVPLSICASLALLWASPGVLSAQEDPAPSFHGKTEVIASRVGTTAAEVGRREVVIDREEIEKLPVQTLQDLLAVLPGIGLTRRGTRGVQGDLNLRGSTFEQSVVMVNGIRVNNPQTGHHNLDLFIPLDAIERIEVLYGPGSAVHGPDAFGGAINIVTGVTAPGSVRLRVGENHLAGAALAGSWQGLWGAIEREVHTGFRDNTEAGGSWMTLDLRLGRRILPTMWLDLEANNIFDRTITEVHGVPLPGRWISVTMSWKGGPR